MRRGRFNKVAFIQAKKGWFEVSFRGDFTVWLDWGGSEVEEDFDDFQKEYDKIAKELSKFGKVRQYNKPEIDFGRIESIMASVVVSRVDNPPEFKAWLLKNGYKEMR